MMLFKQLANVGSYSLQSYQSENMYSAKKCFLNDKGDLLDDYQYGFVLFLDILGFHKIVEESVANEKKVKTIIEIFNVICNQYNNKAWGANYIFPITKDDLTIDKILSEASIPVSMSLFSDSIIITYKPEIKPRFIEWYEQMHQIFNDICRIMYLFAENDIYLRGGLSFGLVHHEGNCCYGPALEEAALMENKIVYPVIGLCDSVKTMVFEDLKSNEIDDYAHGFKTPFELHHFAEDFWGIFGDALEVTKNDVTTTYTYLDWLTNGFFYNRNALSAVSENIKKQCSKNYDDTVKIKYVWLKERFNRATEAPKALGIDMDYSSLKIS